MTNQQGAPATWLTDPAPTPEREFAEWLNERRGFPVSAVFHEIMHRFAALVEAQQPAPSAAADLIAALEEARSAINSMKVEAETAAQGDEQMMLEAYETISNEGLQADMAIRAALASAPQPSPTPQADSQPAPVLDERDDFEKVFPLPSGCIRVGTGYASTGYSNWAAHTHVERWQGWQSRAARAPADSVTAPALKITAPNDSGSAQCIVRWQIETPKGWIGAWNREALDYLLGRAPADSVLEDAAPQAAIGNPYPSMTARHEAFEQGVLKTLAAFRAKHAARKQGAKP